MFRPFNFGTNTKIENWKSLIALREPFIITGDSFLIVINRLIS